MASETVKKILEAESESGKKIADAKRRSDDIISDAERYASVAIQKKLSEANIDIDKIKTRNAVKIADYTKIAEGNCSAALSEIKQKADENSDKAVDAVIKEFFS